MSKTAERRLVPQAPAAIPPRGGSHAPSQRSNAALGPLHLGQGVAMLLLATAFSLPVTASFLELDIAAVRLVPELRTLVDVRIAPLVAAFLLLSAATNWQLATRPA